MTDIWEKLATQSLTRKLTAGEQDFAKQLEDIYARNIHDFGQVCSELNKVQGVKTWTPHTLQTYLAALNSDLEKAYQDYGIGA